MTTEAERREDVRAAFDSVADVYDGPLGNNDVVQWLRGALLRLVSDTFPPGSRLLDLGCGTGIDAVQLAQRGYSVTASDWSPRMASVTRARALDAGVGDRMDVVTLGMHELHRLPARSFDGIYSDLGAVNCVGDPADLAAECARLLHPNGRAILSVIGRICPWEMAYYLARRRPGRAFIRWSRGAVPVSLNGSTVWTRYYTPGELGRQMSDSLELLEQRSLCLFSPPPYLLAVWNRFPRLCRVTAVLDEHLGSWPVIRGGGDHFLAVFCPRPALDSGRGAGPASPEP